MKYLTILIVFFSSIAMGYDGFSGLNKIASVRIYPNDQVLVTMPGAANPGGCISTDYLSLLTPASESGKKSYSAILSAYIAGMPVTFALTGCSDGGTNGWPVIEQVWLQ